MNGFMTKAVQAICVAGGLATIQGCHHYYDVVDPCYPERYRHQSAEAVKSLTGAQTHNGHVLDQTMWNYHFEPGTDKLTPGALDHLNYLARRRPHPDPMLYLQTAHDIAYDAATPGKYPEARGALDSKRVQSIKTYLDAQTSGRGLSFDVTVHDPSEAGLPNLVRALGGTTGIGGSPRGSLQSGGGGGGGTTSGGGGAGGGAGGSQ